jgi:hypothetical protein
MKKEILEFSKSLQDWKSQRASPREGTPEDLKHRAVQLAKKYSAKVIAQECNIGFSTLAGWRAEINRREIKAESPCSGIQKAETDVSLPYTRIDATQSIASTDCRDFNLKSLCTVQIGCLHLDFLDPHFLCQFVVAFNKFGGEQ